MRLCLLLRSFLDRGRKVIKKLDACQFTYGANFKYWSWCWYAKCLGVFRKNEEEGGTETKAV